ncbi:hypothetical protein F1609_20920 [Massilia sp. CCM 8693]|uniref:Glycoside hydrolase family 31 TIM barrel domain-containing protein n=2 Tax=Massilia aquatica TaxID=2609000 RepID=A0ABX0MDX0_9BURK|nr:hypothetical protein [Massilia aquatica]
MAELLERADAPETAHGAPGDAIGTLAGLLANAKNTEGTRLLAPSDLQAIKACGVTFAIGPTVHGAGEIACNTYSLPHTQALIDGLNRDQPGTRQLILPRSGFAGIQRNAVAVWSGW